MRDSNLALSIDLSKCLIQKWCLESAKLAIRPSFCLGLAVSVVDEMFGRIVFGHVPGQVFDTHVRDSSLPLSSTYRSQPLARPRVNVVRLRELVSPFGRPGAPLYNTKQRRRDRTPPLFSIIIEVGV